MLGLRLGLFVVGCALIVGCGGSVPAIPAGVEVSGKVYGPSGSPLKGGTLVLRPTQGLHGVSGEIQSDGSFTLVDARGNKSVVPGSYEVYVSVTNVKDKAVASTVPARYQSSEGGESDGKADVSAAVSDLKIKLKR